MEDSAEPPIGVRAPGRSYVFSYASFRFVTLAGLSEGRELFSAGSSGAAAPGGDPDAARLGYCPPPPPTHPLHPLSSVQKGCGEVLSLPNDLSCMLRSEHTRPRKSQE